MSAGCQSCQERLLDFLYGELDAATQSEVRAHLADCESCQEELTYLGATRSLMEQLPVEEPMRGMEAILQAAEREVRLRADQRPGLLTRLGGFLRVHPVGITAALAATVTLLVVSIDLDQEQARLGGAAMKETAQPPVAEAPAAVAAPVVAEPVPGTAGTGARDTATADLADELHPAERPEEESVAADGLLEDNRERSPETALSRRRASTTRSKDSLDFDTLKKDAELDTDASRPRARPAGKAAAEEELGHLDDLTGRGRRGDAATVLPSDAPKNEASERQAKATPGPAATPMAGLAGKDFEYRQQLPEGGGAGLRGSTAGASNLGQLSGGSSSFASGSTSSRDLGASLDKESKKSDRARRAGAKAQAAAQIAKQGGARAPAKSLPSADAKLSTGYSSPDPAPATAPSAAAPRPAPEAAPKTAPKPAPKAIKARKGKAKKRAPAKAPVSVARSQADRAPVREIELAGADDLDLEESADMISLAGRSPVERRQEQKSSLLRDQLDRASKLVKASRCSDALPLLDAILQQGDSPWRAEAYLYRGTCRSQLGNESDARSDLALAASLDQGRWSRKARKRLRQMESSRMMLDAAAEEAAAEPASMEALE